jgi:hypothetical protein
MDTPYQATKNRFNSLPDNQKLEIINRYVNNYKGGSVEELIDSALESNVAGQLAQNSNYQF